MESWKGVNKRGETPEEAAAVGLAKAGQGMGEK